MPGSRGSISGTVIQKVKNTSATVAIASSQRTGYFDHISAAAPVMRLTTP